MRLVPVVVIASFGALGALAAMAAIGGSLAACGSGSDAPASDGSAEAGPGAAPFACEAADLTTAPEVVPVLKAGDPPSPAGGTLTPGRYVMTSMTFYFGNAPVPSPSKTKYRDVLEISGGEQRSTAVAIGGSTGAGTSYTVGSVSVSGTTKATTFRCASSAGIAGNKNSEPFTATADKIMTFTGSAPTLVQELTRQ